MKITIVPHQGKAITYETTPVNLKIDDLGIYFVDETIDMPCCRTFDKIKSFKIECDVDEKLSELSKGIQRARSDANPEGKKSSARWTVH